MSVALCLLAATLTARATTTAPTRHPSPHESYETVTLGNGILAPYSFGSWLREWTQTLGKLKALGAIALVPGHGPVLRDSQYVDTLIGLVEETRAQVQAAVKEGSSLDDTRKKVDLGSYRRKLAGNDYWRQRAFDEFFFGPAVGQAYKEARGETMEE
jgi:glyoxylase-like metal-dependent hydrolase (beta-lactamase superfamily II)